MNDEEKPYRKDRASQFGLRRIIKFTLLFSIPLAVVANLPRQLRDFVVEQLADPFSVVVGVFLLLFFLLPLLPVLLRPDFGTPKTRRRRRWYERRRSHDRHDDEDDGTTS